MSKPTEDQVYEQIDKAAATAYASRWPGMSYEAGVDAALRWAIGESEEPPMEDE